MLPNFGHYTFTYFAWVNLLSILKSVNDICNHKSSCSKEKCYFILYSVTANLAAFKFSFLREMLLHFILCNRESDGRIQTFLARPPNSKMIINICFISGPKAAKTSKISFSKFQNCVYIYVFSAPRTLIAIFCLFSCFLLVIRSRTGIWSVDWEAVQGHFFSSYVFLGPCPQPQLSAAKEMNTVDTVKLPRKYLCGGQLQVWDRTR